MARRAGNNLSEGEPISVQEGAGLWRFRGKALGGDGRHDSTVPVDWKLPPFRQGINLLIDPRGFIAATSETKLCAATQTNKRAYKRGKDIRREAAAERAEFEGL